MAEDRKPHGTKSHRRRHVAEAAEGPDPTTVVAKKALTGAAAGAAGATPRRSGGPVSRGRAYRVGEAGPEKFVPKAKTRGRTRKAKTARTRRTK